MESNIDLSKEFDYQSGQRSGIYEKYTDYNAVNQKSHTPGPYILTKDINHSDAELYRITEQMRKYYQGKKNLEKNSLKKYENVKKKTKVLDNLSVAQKIALIVAMGSSIASVAGCSCVLGNYVYQKIERENEFQQTVDYMNEFVMPEVLNRAGFTQALMDDNNKFIYNYDSTSIQKAKDILVNEYGLGYDSAELAVAKYFNYDDTLYIVRGYNNSDDYYASLGYKNYDNYDKLLSSNTDIFENMIQTSFTGQVENMMATNQKGDDSNAR